MSKSIFSDAMLAALRNVRRAEHEGVPRFSIIDFVLVLTGTSNPRRYWMDIKRRNQHLSVVRSCVQLKLVSSDGKAYKTDVATIDQLIEIALAVPSMQAHLYESLSRDDWFWALTSERLRGWKLAGMMTSKSCEWYTPAKVMERVRVIINPIDLDPCSSPEANTVVRAEKIFTLADDGLSQDWSCASRIYMNPPYGADISQWTLKLVDTVNSRPGISAIALLPNRTDTKWYRALSDYPHCHVRGRLKFWGPSQSKHSATFPSVIVGLGVDLRDFELAFKPLGNIYLRHDHEQTP